MNALTKWTGLFAMGLLASGASQATLYDRGGGLIYDDVLNVTWLADANYAKTSGYDSDGLMNWSAATTWAANLSYVDSVRGVTYDDWRLPTVLDTGLPGCNWSYSDSGTDCGYNVQTASGGTVYSELAYMYYVNLGFKGAYSTSGVYQSDYGIFGNGTIGGERDDLGPNGAIDNLQSDLYWSGTAYAPVPAISAWIFSTALGFQGDFDQIFEFYAWAVRPGDVAAGQSVPEPMSVALLGLGLMGLAVVRRRRSFGAS